MTDISIPLSVLVVGTVFIDCKGFAGQNYRPDARNLGRIQFVHGGVGRNVAENLANLGLPALFASTVDDNALGQEVVLRLQNSQVNTDYLIESEGRGMGMWLAILDEKGELAGSVSHMSDLSRLQELVTGKGKEMAGRCTHIALEMDLNEHIARSVIKLAEDGKKPVYGVCGNLEVVLRHRDLLGRLACFICNEFEAEQLFDPDFTSLDPDSMQASLIQYADRTGMRAMVVTLGGKGAVYYDSRTKDAGYQPALPVKLVDSSGAGDAFFSGTVMGLIKGLPLSDAVLCGTKVAAWTIASAENTCKELPLKIKRDPFFQSIE